jgi:hypothetical protein
MIASSMGHLGVMDALLEGAAQVGLGGIVVSEREAPRLLVNRYSVDERWRKALRSAAEPPRPPGRLQAQVRRLDRDPLLRRDGAGAVPAPTTRSELAAPLFWNRLAFSTPAL